MRVWDVLREKKRCVRVEPWKTGRMPREAFPLSKNRGFVLGATWRWSVSHVEAPAGRFRLLVAFDRGKDQYRAWLAFEDGLDQAVLARLEYHPDHRYWHCHMKRGALSDVARGVVREPGHRERCWSCHNENTLTVTELDGLSIAFKVFKIEHPPEGMSAI